MYSIGQVNYTKKALVFFNGKDSVCSFPVSLNKSMPSVDDAIELCNDWTICGINELFSTIVESNKVDSKGRKIGFMINVVEWKNQVYGNVQNTRNGQAFGVPQRSKKFSSETQAIAACKAIANDRISKLK